MSTIRLEKVLLIESDAEDALFMESLLRRCFCFESTQKKFQVLKTQTLSEALQITKLQVIDFIFLDMGG